MVTQDASLPWGGRYVGHDGVTTFAFARMGATDSAVIVESGTVQADGQVIQCGRSKGTVRSNGKTFDIPEVTYLDLEGPQGRGRRLCH